MSKIQRFEQKYILDLSQYYRILAALRYRLKPDTHALKMPNLRYTVRSLYYDSPDYKAYHEKMSGEYGRIKCRLRSYDQQGSQDTLIKVELKCRRGVFIEKHTGQVSFEHYQYFVKHGHWPALGQASIEEFERLLLLGQLKPMVLIEYEREAYYCLADPNLRITFDHDTRSVKATELFQEHLFFHTRYPKSIILEIKTQHSCPAWLEHILRQQSLVSEPNSKYSTGIETSSYDLDFSF